MTMQNHKDLWKDLIEGEHLVVSMSEEQNLASAHLI